MKCLLINLYQTIFGLLEIAFPRGNKRFPAFFSAVALIFLNLLAALLIVDDSFGKGFGWPAYLITLVFSLLLGYYHYGNPFSPIPNESKLISPINRSSTRRIFFLLYLLLTVGIFAMI